MDDGPLRPPTLLAMPSYLAGHVSRIGHRKLVEALKVYDLRLPHFAVLAALGDFGAMAQHELADRLGLNRSHLVGYLDDLEKLVRRERDPEDRRRQWVALTPAGRRLLRQLDDVAQRSQAEFLQVLTPAERVLLVEMMRRVVVADDEETGPRAEA